jgi:transposase
MSYTIGIDVSKDGLDCAGRIDLDQVKTTRHHSTNTQKGFSSLLTWAKKISGQCAKDLAFIIEPTSIYHDKLVAFMFACGATVYLVNPARVRKFAEGIGILSKNDVIDADLLSYYGFAAKKLIVFKPLSQDICALTSFMNRIRTLDKDLRREQNRQEKSGRASVFDKLEERSIQRLVKQRKNEIKRFEEAIRKLIKQSDSLHKDYELLLSIPGVGEKTAWIMLIVLKSQSFASAKEAAKFLGLNPIEKRSGKKAYRRPRLSKAGNGFFRQALYFPAIVATTKNPDIQAQYERLLANNKTKMCAIGAAMRKLVHICYGVLKSQRPYESQRQVVKRS